MPTQVDVPGHGIVEFPDGMTDDQISKAIQSNMPKMPQSTLRGSALGGVVQGVRDPVDAGAQLLTHLLPQSVVDIGNKANNWLAENTGLVGKLPAGGVDEKIKSDEQAYQQSRSANGRDGMDLSRMSGNILATLPLGGGPAPASVLGQVAKGTLQGGMVGALQPVTQGNFAEEKAKQVGLGAGLGGALAPLGAMMGNSTSKAKAQAEILKAQNATKDETLKAAQGLGMKVPPSTVNPSLLNRGLESAAGKLAVENDMSLANDRIAQSVIRKAIGLPEDAPLTGESLAAYRKVLSGPYKEMSALDTTLHAPNDLNLFTLDMHGMKIPDKIIKNTVGASGNTVRTISPSDALEKWKQLNFDAKTLYNKVSKSPEDIALAREYESQADKLFTLMQQGAKDSGKPELAQALADARVNIAKVHTVDNAVKEGGGYVDSRKLAQMLQKDAPLNGDLRTIGAFANVFDKANKPITQIGSPNVSNLSYKMAALMSGLGGVAGGVPGAVAGALLPDTARNLARKLVTSDAYQKMAANPEYGIGPTRKLLAELLSSGYLPPAAASLAAHE